MSHKIWLIIPGTMKNRKKTNLKYWKTTVLYIELLLEHSWDHSASEFCHFLKCHSLL